MNLDASVVTVSTRAFAGMYEDKSGPVITEALNRLEFWVIGPILVPDGERVAEQLRVEIAAGRALVITTGGTGINPTDQTPEMTAPLLDKELPHLAAAIARYGQDHGVPTSMLSRGIAGVAGRTLVINLPGSRGGAADGMTVLKPVLMHAVQQIRGGDH